VGRALVSTSSIPGQRPVLRRGGDPLHLKVKGVSRAGARGSLRRVSTSTRRRRSSSRIARRRRSRGRACGVAHRQGSLDGGGVELAGGQLVGGGDTAGLRVENARVTRPERTRRSRTSRRREASRWPRPGRGAAGRPRLDDRRGERNTAAAPSTMLRSSSRAASNSSTCGAARASTSTPAPEARPRAGARTAMQPLDAGVRLHQHIEGEVHRLRVRRGDERVAQDRRAPRPPTKPHPPALGQLGPPGRLGIQGVARREDEPSRCSSCGRRRADGGRAPSSARSSRSQGGAALRDLALVVRKDVASPRCGCRWCRRGGASHRRALDVPPGNPCRPARRRRRAPGGEAAPAAVGPTIGPRAGPIA